MCEFLLTQKPLSQIIEVSERTLERWRVEGSGPAFVKAGRKCLYRMADVDAWLSANRRTSTGDLGGSQ